MTRFSFRPAKVCSRSRARRESGRSRGSISWATTSPSRSRTVATGCAMRRSITAISASNCIARRAMAGRRSRHPPIRPSRKATRSTTCGAGRSTGARRASGRSRPAVPTSPASSGAERCRADSSAPSIMARAGTWCVPCGTIPSAGNGWAAAPICPAFIRSASIRAIPSACGLRSRPAASGSPRMPAQAGACAAKACAPNTLRPSRPTIPLPRTCIASRNAERRRSACGCSITTASSSLPTRARRSRRSPASSLRHSASRSSCTRASPTPRGSSPRSRTRNASRARANSSSRARATAAKASMFSPRAYRSRTPMTSSIAMRWRSTTRASGSPSARRRAGCG